MCIRGVATVLGIVGVFIQGEPAPVDTVATTYVVPWQGAVIAVLAVSLTNKN